MTSNNRNNPEYDYLFKILLIGDSGVGKSTILQRFSQDYFSTEYVATIGVDFQIRTLDIDSTRCKIQVWDTAGQERFKSVVGTFYRNANGVIICFDLTDLQSFYNVNNWHDEVKRYCLEGTQMFLVGTKSDLKAKRVVSSEMIQAFIDEKKLKYIETSSKLNQNVEQCFIDFTKKLIEQANQLKLNPRPRPQPSSNINVRPISAPEEKSGGCTGGGKCTI